MKIEAGTTCFVSTIGHNGFWYPIYNGAGMTEVIEDIEHAKVKSWICGKSELMAIEVPANKIRDLYGDPSSMTVVWIHRESVYSTD